MLFVAVIVALLAIYGFGNFAFTLMFWPWIGTHQAPSADQTVALASAAGYSLFIETPVALVVGWIGWHLVGD